MSRPIQYAAFLGFRTDESTKQRFEELARQKGTSVTEELRRLVQLEIATSTMEKS